MRSLSQARRADAEARHVLVIVCAGVILASLDLFIVNLALPAIARDFGGAEISSLSWVLNAYAIAYAALLVPLGRLSERRRRDTAFLVGVLVFTAASAACALASNLPWLVAFRVVQAAGAALLTPTSLGLILATTPAPGRASAVRAWTAVGGAAAALGPVVGGALVAVGWRWVFLVNVPVGLLAAAYGWWRLPRVAGHDVADPDVSGSVLIALSTSAVTLALVEGNGWGWSSPRELACLAVAAVALAGFAVHTARARNPLVDPALLRSRSFSGAGLVALVFSAAFGAMLLSVVFWMQEVWGWSALRTGLAFAPGPLMVPLFGLLLAGRLIARYGAGRVIAAGSTAVALGLAWWAWRITLEPNYLLGVLPGTLLTGVGVGLTLPTFMAAGAAALPPASFATGSAVLNMLRQLGFAIGVAGLVAVLGAPRSPGAALEAYQRGWLAVAVTAVAAAGVGAFLLRGRGRPAAVPAAAPGTDADAGAGPVPVAAERGAATDGAAAQG